MPRIPKDIDFGGRPSLRSGRVDVPGRGDLQVADALESAATNFANIMIDRKGQQDRFNYAMAKNEALTGIIKEREKLKDDQDWDTYDERFREGVRSELDRITSHYQMNPHDRAIFDAELKLLTERGAIEVGSLSRKVEIDEKVSGLSAALAAARETIILASPGERNDLLLTQLEAVTALEDEAVLTDVQAEKARQVVVVL